MLYAFLGLSLLAPPAPGVPFRQRGRAVTHHATVLLVCPSVRLSFWLVAGPISAARTEAVLPVQTISPLFRGWLRNRIAVWPRRSSHSGGRSGASSMDTRAEFPLWITGIRLRFHEDVPSLLGLFCSPSWLVAAARGVQFWLYCCLVFLICCWRLLEVRVRAWGAWNALCGLILYILSWLFAPPPLAGAIVDDGRRPKRLAGRSGGCVAVASSRKGLRCTFPLAQSFPAFALVPCGWASPCPDLPLVRAADW